MKVLISPILYILLLSIHANVMQATPVAPEVNRLYAAAQQGDMRGVEYILDWHRADDKKKPTTLLQQARALAVDKNDAQAAVVLTTRLKQEQMGSWERYFRGITLAATVTVAAVLVGIAGFNKYKVSQDQQNDVVNPSESQQKNEQWRQEHEEHQQAKHQQEVDGRSFMARLFGRNHSQSTTDTTPSDPVEREMEDFRGRDRNYPDDSVTGQADQHRLSEVRPESKRSSQ
jgi:hypothetical protein